MQDSRYLYLRWGAAGKVRQLDEMHPHPREEAATPAPAGTIGAPVEHLDLATVIKVSQAVSGEIVLEKLIDTLMRTAIQQGGAERGVLLLPRGAELRIEAEATTGGDVVLVQLREQPVTAAALPESVLNYVLRTRDSVILDHAAQSAFAADPYFQRRQAQSILCLPLIAQGRQIGLLYLENNLTAGVFAPGRMAVLKLLASQAAIALENASLYGDLAEREAKIRRLVDANIIGICISRSEGEIIEANDAFLKIVGYDREDLASGRLRWTSLATPESRRPGTALALAELQRTGTIQPFEKEYFRRDGTRVPVLIGVAAFDQQRDEVVAFVLDLTERERAEEKARESERRYHEVAMEPVHTNRVALMGQLSASIVHEVSQPIAAAATNAKAGLRWLNATQPDIDEVAQALGRIVENASRASEVIGRIRALIKKAPPHQDDVAMNDAVGEIVALAGDEAKKIGATVQTRLQEGLPPIRGDRVQLQQVILNLIINAVEALSEVADAPRELLISAGTEASGDVRVAVCDSGPGLEPAKLERLFEAFYTTKPGGLGMGLLICRSIIEAHGGRLWAEANDARGAIFQFTVPARP